MAFCTVHVVSVAIHFDHFEWHLIKDTTTFIQLANKCINIKI